jgi:hypothetical protein
VLAATPRDQHSPSAPRFCDACGRQLVDVRADARFCGATCRQRSHRAASRDTSRDSSGPDDGNHSGRESVTAKSRSRVRINGSGHAYSDVEGEIYKLVAQLALMPDGIAAVERVRDHLSGRLQAARFGR